jgi:hypothetical protein
MASVNEPGQLRIVVERVNGLSKVVWSGRSDGPVNAGKSPDGVLANLTADKQLYVGYMGPVLSGGDIVRIMFKPDGTDGLDVSDGVTMVPIWEDGLRKDLNNTDFGNTTDLTPVASRWQELGTGYTVPTGIKKARLGNGQLVISVEDDTG